MSGIHCHLHLFKCVALCLSLSAMLSVSACSTGNSQGRFELELQSSVFGEISIEQGKSATATVAINRHADSVSDTIINMSLIDPPSWLHYTFDHNPANGNISTLRLNIDEDASPGIYRLILHGEHNTPEQVVDDHETFHLVVKSANAA